MRVEKNSRDFSRNAGLNRPALGTANGRGKSGLSKKQAL
jgi:hypothetical protein